MKNKLFLPVEPDGSLIIPAMVVQHLGLNTDGLLAVNLPMQASCCQQCAELELNLSATCDEDLCIGYATDGEVINLPQDLLDLVDIPAGSDLTVICLRQGLLFVPDEVWENPASIAALTDDRCIVLPLQNFCDGYDQDA